MRLHEIITEGDPVADAQGSRINWDEQGNAIVPRDVMVKYQKLQQEDPEAWKKLSGWKKKAYNDQFARNLRRNGTGIRPEDPRVIASREKRLGKDQTAVAGTGVEPNFSTPKPNTAADDPKPKITQYTVRRDANKVSTADLGRPDDGISAIAGGGADVPTPKPKLPMGGRIGVINRKKQK